MAATALDLIQLGQESTWATPVAATIQLAGVTRASVQQIQTIYQPEEIGIVGPSNNALLAAVRAAASIEMDCSYEHLLYLFSGLYGAATITGSGPYVHTYYGPYGSAVTPKIYTVQLGQSALGPVRLAGGLINSVRISAEADGIWKATAEMIGSHVQANALTALSKPAVTLIRAADTVIYVDAWGGTIGSTALTAALISFQLELETGRHLKPYVGSLTPLAHGDTRHSGRLTLRLELTSTVNTLVETALSSTPTMGQRLVRIKATSGTLVAQLDFYGTLFGAPQTLWEDRDGNKVVEVVLLGTYNTTDAKWLAPAITNGMSALT